MDVKKIPNRYRPIPFWSWNEKLEVKETVEQVAQMKDVGLGGFIMHARGGLETEYMGEEWFENIEAGIAEAEKFGMRPWAYDEFGWPSGFGSGTVNGLGPEYQQKFLRMESMPEHREHTICRSGEHYFYYEVNPYYVDVCDEKVIKAFIEYAYEPYYRRYGNRIEGFFTDEPQISRNGIPWSFRFEAEYRARYQDNLLDHLEELFLPRREYRKTRIRFWKMVTDLFSNAYMKQIYQWCEERNLKLTGHLVLEENMEIQLPANGSCMPHYEYMHIPGMDWLRRPVYDCLTARQVSSVAQQLGKEAVISETFALCGHNVSMAQLKGMYEWQMVRGINLLCQHLEGYSLRGIRKRDYPPAMYYQQPWWSEYGKWNDAVSREGMLLTEGQCRPDILVIHPQTTAWALFDNDKNAGLKELNAGFLKDLVMLEQKHVDFHLGDETILQRHGKVEGNRIVVGNQSYSHVITGCCEELLDSTRELLAEFRAQGGKIVSAEEIPDNPVVNDPAITYTLRYLDGKKLHFFANSSQERKTAQVNAQGRKLNIYTGEWEDFTGEHDFEPWGSLMLLEDGTQNLSGGRQKEDLIRPEGMFEIKDSGFNVLTLDKCDYYFDGVLEERNGYILNVCERANKLERRVHIRWDFRVNLREIPSVLYLACETPEKFRILVNGQEIDKAEHGYFRDKSFRKLDIRPYVKKEWNLISFECDFRQSDRFYEHVKRARVSEGEINMLYYDIEIEAVYLLGDFSVRTDGTWKRLQRDDWRYSGEFVIDQPVKRIALRNIQRQGFPFFCGELTVAGEVDVQGENPVLDLECKGVNAVRVEIGGIQETLLTNHRLPLASLERGKHPITLTLINNLHNMLGPHHLEVGQSYIAGPFCFYQEDCLWSKPVLSGPWNSDYCFAEFGLASLSGE